MGGPPAWGRPDNREGVGSAFQALYQARCIESTPAEFLDFRVKPVDETRELESSADACGLCECDLLTEKR